MERDFLGLSMKQETSDEPAAPLRSSTMHWSFPNKASSIPQLLSFQEEKGKTAFGCLAITTDAFDGDRKAYVSPKKSVVPERNGVTTYPATHHDSHIIHHTVGNQIAAPAGSVHRPIDLSLGSQPFVSVPFANPSVTAPVVGSTDLRSGSKISGGPTQLTLFYNGSVCVYDNISPDKAHAIMLLAGNGVPPTPAPFVVSATPHRSSPIAVTPLTIVQPNVHSCTNIEPIAAAKTTGLFMSSSVIAEPLRLSKSLGSASLKFHSSDTVPQFRKKSLARFLEKRKERVIIASPYADKEPPEQCSNRSSNASGTRPVPAMN